MPVVLVPPHLAHSVKRLDRPAIRQQARHEVWRRGRPARWRSVRGDQRPWLLGGRWRPESRLPRPPEGIINVRDHAVRFEPMMVVHHCPSRTITSLFFFAFAIFAFSFSQGAACSRRPRELCWLFAPQSCAPRGCGPRSRGSTAETPHFIDAYGERAEEKQGDTEEQR